MRTTRFLILGLATTLCLSACGGGGSSGGSKEQTLEIRYDYSDAATQGLAVFHGATLAPPTTDGLGSEQPRFRVVGGALPQGMKLNSKTGVVSGVPTENGKFEATIRLTVDGYSGALDADLKLGVSELHFDYSPYGDGLTLMLPVGARMEPLKPSFGKLASGVSCSFERAGTLPAGLQFDASSGTFSGTPTRIGDSATPEVTATCSRSGTTVQTSARVDIYVDVNDKL